MKKNNLIKTIGFSSMALFMGALTIFGFVPMAKAQPLATASETATEYTTEEPTGLITPKADDPVIYTTESGLEIKWGNALPSTYNGSLSSGNLAGFPYFTTTKSSTTYTWVIIGRNSNTETFATTITNFLFSNWKTSTYPSTSYHTSTTYSKYFFDNTYETSTPAGSAINSATASKSYVIDYAKNLTPKTSSEIPSGCVLCLTNDVVEYQKWTSSNATADPSYFSSANNLTRKLCESYYTNDKFGFGSNKSYIQTINLTQRSSYYTYINNTESWNWSNTSTSLKFFPLGTGGTTGALPTAVNVATIENFRWQTYLTADQVKCSKAFWGRSHKDSNDVFYTTTTGTVTTLDWGHASATNIYIRPACVISLA